MEMSFLWESHGKRPIVILRLYFRILKSINFVVLHVSLYMWSYLVDTKPELHKFNSFNCIVFHINIIIM